MSEKRLWDYLREGMGSAGHFDRIESTFTVNGRPDVNYCMAGVEGDIELKIYDKRKGGFVLRSSQVAWFKRRISVGGNCWIIARYDYMTTGRGKRFIIIKGENAHHLAHDRSYEGWLAQAYRVWDDSIDWTELKNIIKGKS